MACNSKKLTLKPVCLPHTLAEYTNLIQCDKLPEDHYSTHLNARQEQEKKNRRQRQKDLPIPVHARWLTLPLLQQMLCQNLDVF